MNSEGKNNETELINFSAHLCIKLEAHLDQPFHLLESHKFGEEKFTSGITEAKVDECAKASKPTPISINMPN